MQQNPAEGVLEKQPAQATISCEHGESVVGSEVRSPAISIRGLYFWPSLQVTDPMQC